MWCHDQSLKTSESTVVKLLIVLLFRHPAATDFEILSSIICRSNYSRSCAVLAGCATSAAKIVTRGVNAAPLTAATLVGQLAADSVGRVELCNGGVVDGADRNARPTLMTLRAGRCGTSRCAPRERQRPCLLTALLSLWRRCDATSLRSTVQKGTQPVPQLCGPRLPTFVVFCCVSSAPGTAVQRSS